MGATEVGATGATEDAAGATDVTKVGATGVTEDAAGVIGVGAMEDKVGVMEDAVGAAAAAAAAAAATALMAMSLLSVGGCALDAHRLLVPATISKQK